MIAIVTGAVIVGGVRYPVQVQVTIPDPEPAEEEEGRA
jgi:hypothetical protein